jgi:hypothetical protein
MACGDSVYYLGIKSVKSSKFLVEEGSVHFVNIYNYLRFIFVIKKYGICEIMTPY